MPGTGTTDDDQSHVEGSRSVEPKCGRVSTEDRRTCEEGTETPIPVGPDGTCGPREQVGLGDRHGPQPQPRPRLSPDGQSTSSRPTGGQRTRTRRCVSTPRGVRGETASRGEEDPPAAPGPVAAGTVSLRRRPTRTAHLPAVPGTLRGTVGAAIAATGGVDVGRHWGRGGASGTRRSPSTTFTNLCPWTHIVSDQSPPGSRGGRTTGWPGSSYGWTCTGSRGPSCFHAVSSPPVTLHPDGDRW